MIQKYIYFHVFYFYPYNPPLRKILFKGGEVVAATLEQPICEPYTQEAHAAGLGKIDSQLILFAL